MPSLVLRRVTVLLPEDVMIRFNSYCAENGFKKSTLLAKLLRDHLAGAARSSPHRRTSPRSK